MPCMRARDETMLLKFPGGHLSSNQPLRCDLRVTLLHHNLSALFRLNKTK